MSRIQIVEQTGSTNSDLMKLAKRGEAQGGDWLFAKIQTAGRGRRGRNWDSRLGNLHASTLVVLSERDPPAHTLSLVAAWALWSSISVSCAELKWPNDIVVGGRKLAGILLERNGIHVVVGFGVNIVHAPELTERPTTCLNEWAAEVGGVEALDIFNLLQARFEENLAKWRSEGFDVIRRLWESEGPSRGDLLRVDLQNGMSVQGAYDGLADDGALRLLLASGRAELVYAGDVSMIEEY